MSPVTVLIVDHVYFYLDGLRRALEAVGDLTIVGVTPNPDAALEQAQARPPAVIFLNVELPGHAAAAAIPPLSTACTGGVIVTVPGPEHGFVALGLGARGVCRREAGPEEVLEAFRAVARGERRIEFGTMARLGSQIRQCDQDRQREKALTDREREVLALIGLRKDNEEIARHLFTSAHTIRTHVHHLMEKLNIHDRDELERYAWEAELRRRFVDACLAVLDGVMPSPLAGSAWASPPASTPQRLNAQTPERLNAPTPTPETPSPDPASYTRSPSAPAPSPCSSRSGWRSPGSAAASPAAVEWSLPWPAAALGGRLD